MRLTEARAELHAHLRERREEVEQATLAKVNAIADPTEVGNALYREQLRKSVSAAIDYALETIGRGDSIDSQIPVELLAQARLAARNEVPLDTVIRRYLAGYALLTDLLIGQADAGGAFGAAEARHIVRANATVLDCLLTAIATSYRRESEPRPAGAEKRRIESIERLLGEDPAPEPPTAELPYDFDAWHLGLIAVGSGGRQLVEAILSSRDCLSLTVEVKEGTIWAWLAARTPFASEEIGRDAKCAAHAGMRLAIGEAAWGLCGWRLSHRQAAAALALAERTDSQSVRYADVALLASAVRDEVLVTSLNAIYLDPMRRDRDGGEVARETLRAYLASGLNVTSAAARLGVRRQTVTRRLQVLEQRLGQPLAAIASELDVALRLHQLTPRGAGPPQSGEAHGPERTH